jgi:hypothetical protein
MTASLWMRRTLMGWLVSLMPLAGGMAWADIVIPSSQFNDLGVLNVTNGGTFTTGNGTPTLLVGGTTYDGQIYTYAGGLQAAVFQFDSITESGGRLGGSGSLPVILLSYGAVKQTGGIINFDGGGPGGAAPGQGPGHGGANSGGSFGGVGVGGGPTYGDLSVALQGGSGGGGNAFGGGGAGGGALEIASNSSITLSGGISAAGGNVGGGGSGGGILLYAPTITNNTTLNASGGDDGAFGGGGGGGRILIDTAPGGLTGIGTLNVAGGGGQNNSIGGAGSITILTTAGSAVPEPSPLMLGGLGALVLGALRQWKRWRVGS